MTMKLADDFTAIARRLDQLRKDHPDWMPRCKLCSDTGWRRVPPDELNYNGWRRVICPACQNPEGKS